MAEKKASLLLEIKDKATKPIQGIGGALQKFRQHWLAITAAVGGFVAFASSSVKAFIQQENAVEKLNVALRNQGITSQAVSNDLQNFASGLQKITAVGDETILEVQALLTTFGLTGDQLKKTTVTALDLSKGLGIDLKASALLLGKAFAGDIATLSRYGIKIQEGLAESEKFDAVMQQLNTRFGGAAQAELNTFAGRITNLNNRLGDIKERIGQEIIPVLETWARWGEKLIAITERLTNSSKDNFTVNEHAINQLTKQRNKIIELAENRATAHDGVLRLTEAERNQIRIITDQLNVLKKRVEEEKISNDQRLVNQEEFVAGQNEIEDIKTETDNQRNEEKLSALDIQIQSELERIQFRQESENILVQQFGETRGKLFDKFLDENEKRQLSNFTTKLKEQGKFQEATLLEEQAFHEASKLQDEKREEDRRKLQKDRLSAADASLNALNSLTQGKSKELGSIIRGLGSGRALVDSYVAAQGARAALSSIPIVGPALGNAAYAAILAQGFANVARINSVQFAHGGMVLPTRGGTIGQIGEAGKSEAVIPLEDERTKEKLRDTFGGGLTININAGTVIANDESAMEFARMIDEKLFSLKRNNQSVAFG